MGKKWVRCDTLLQENEDILAIDCLTSILEGKIDIYTESGRRLVNINIAQIKGPGTKQDIDKDSEELSARIGGLVRRAVGPTPDRVFDPKSPAKSEAINARLECMMGIYYFVYPATAVLDDFRVFQKLIDCPKHLQLQELAKFMFKYEDAVRCFGLPPVEEVPVSVGVPHGVLVAEAEVAEHGDASTKNAKSSPCRGRKQKLADMECLKIYRQHYDDGIPISTLSKDFDWKNSAFADNPKFETAKSRINTALKRGHELTSPHARPPKDNVGRK